MPQVTMADCLGKGGRDGGGRWRTQPTQTFELTEHSVRSASHLHPTPSHTPSPTPLPPRYTSTHTNHHHHHHPLAHVSTTCHPANHHKTTTSTISSSARALKPSNHDNNHHQHLKSSSRRNNNMKATPFLKISFRNSTGAKMKEENKDEDEDSWVSHDDDLDNDNKRVPGATGNTNTSSTFKKFHNPRHILRSINQAVIGGGMRSASHQQQQQQQQHRESPSSSGKFHGVPKLGPLFRSKLRKQKLSTTDAQEDEDAILGSGGPDADAAAAESPLGGRKKSQSESVASGVSISNSSVSQVEEFTKGELSEIMARMKTLED